MCGWWAAHISWNIFDHAYHPENQLVLAPPDIKLPDAALLDKSRMKVQVLWWETRQVEND